jgi:hypothetical protein
MSSPSRRPRRSSKSRNLELSLRPLKQSFPDQSDSGRVTGGCWGLVGPRPSFEETLVMFDHFWDFDRLVEYGTPRRSGDHEISPFLWAFWDFRVYVTGMGCRPMGLPMLRPLFVMYK